MAAVPKFSREDDQLLALNYENLCDADYVNRLFCLDSAAEGSQAASHSQQAVHNDWMLTPEIAEDVIMFGESKSVGFDFLIQRMLNDGGSLHRAYEPATAMILKQVKIFSYIGNLVRDRCGQCSSRCDNGRSAEIGGLEAISQAFSGPATSVGLVPDALSCALSVLDNRSRRVGKLPLKAVSYLLSSILESLLQLRSVSLSGATPRQMLSTRQAQSLRSVLCSGILKGLEDATTAVDTTLVSDDVEGSLRLAMSCVYGLFSVGVLSQCPGDVLLAAVHLMVIHSFVESFIPQLTEKVNVKDEKAGVVESAPAIECQEKLRMKYKLKENKKAALKQSPIVIGSEIREDSLSPVPTERSTHSVIPMKFRDGGNSGIKRDVSQKAKMSLQIKGRPGSDGHSDDNAPGLISKRCHGNIGSSQTNTVAMSMSLDTAGGASYFSAAVLQQSKSGPILHKKGMHRSTPLQTSNNNDDEMVPAGTCPVSPLANQTPYDESWNSISYNTAFDDILNVPSGLLAALAVSSNSAGSETVSQNKRNIKNRINEAADCKTEIFTCGQNSYGELGHGDVMIRKSFDKVSFFEAKSIVAAGAGNEHTVFVSSLGKVYVSGYNDNGQCGLGSTQQVRQPSLVTAIEGEDISKVHVYNGSEHTLLVTRDGRLFAFGYNYRGQLGLGTTASEVVPRLVKGLLSKKVRSAACSYHHSAVICSDGSMFTFGRNDCGQLGHGDCIDRKTPQLVTNINIPVVSISCGQFHTTFVNNAGQAMACGKNDFGQIGLENVESSKIFLKMEGLSPQETQSNGVVSQVCCGYYHTLVLLHNGVVYGCGRNDYGQLGLGHTQPRVHGLQVVSGLREKLVSSLSCGCYHSVAITSNGMLYVFGRNNHGQLGTGDNEERHLPHPVDNFVGRKIITVAAGFYHSVVLVGQDDLSSDAAAEIMLDSSDFAQYYDDIDQEDFKQTELHAHRANLDLRYQHSCDTPPRRPTSDLNGNSHESSSESFFSTKDYPTTATIADLLKLLIIYVKHIPDHDSLYDIPVEAVAKMKEGDVLSFQSYNLFDSIIWISQQFRCLAALIELTRRFLSPAENVIIDLPFTDNEAINLLNNLLRAADRFLTKARSMVIHIFDICQVDAATDEEIFSNSLLSFNGIVSPKSILMRLFDISFESFHGSDTGGGARCKIIRERFVTDISWLRRELLLTYFFLPREIENSDEAAHRCFSCIVKNSRLLFWSTRSYSIVLSFLADQIQEADYPPHERERSDSVSSTTPHCFGGRQPDFLLCFRLFSKLCASFRDIREVVKLFRNSIKGGMDVCLQITKVYCSVSVSCLEGKFCVGSISTASAPDMAMQFSILEYCCTNFVKCALPVALSPCLDSNSYLPHAELGGSIISCILQAAARTISFISRQEFGEDTMNSLRFGTVLPNVVPTILLFGIADARSVGALKFVLPCVIALKNELKKLSPSEFQIPCPFSSSQKTLLNLEPHGVAPAPCHAKEAAFSTDDVASKAGQSDTLCVNTAASKKDPMFPWLTRLLRLSAIFTTKLSNILYLECLPTVFVKYIPSTGVSSSELSVETCSEIGDLLLNEHDFLASISRSVLWKYLDGPQDAVLVNFLSGNDIIANSADSRRDELSFALRSAEYSSNSNYRFTTARDTPTNVILRSIENEIFGVALYIEEPYLRLLKHTGLSMEIFCRTLFSKVWHSIALLTGFIHTQRTVILGRTDLNWKDILGNLLIQVRRFSSLLMSCDRRVLLSPLLVSNNSRRVHPALRRVMLVVLASIRWKATRKHNYRLAKDVVVSAAETLIKSLLFKDSGAVDTMLSKASLDEVWLQNIKSLICSRNLVNNHATGLAILCDVLNEPLFSSMRCDVLLMVTSAWKLDTLTQMNSNALNMCKTNLEYQCRGSTDSLRRHNYFTKQLLAIFLAMLCEFSSESSTLTELPKCDFPSLMVMDNSVTGRFMPTNDIVTLTLVFKSLNYMIAVDDTIFSLLGKNLHMFICHVYTNACSSVDRLRDVNSVEDKTTAPVKRTAIKERVSLLRRCVCACVGLLQRLCVKSVQLGFDCTEACRVLLVDVCARLVAQLQRSVLLTPSSSVDAAVVTSEREVKKGSNNFPSDQFKPGPNLPANSSINSAAAQKKRCQELISQPMSFCKGQEGFVVQGDKLLSNFKGVDFTISTWIYVTKKEAGKHYFITGKVSHNDAWPLLVLRGIDGKIDLAYGRANEFDRLTTSASIPLNCWTHIAVVSDPRKFKIFINGQLDSQTATVGNARAILYPLVIGSCPLGVRTRVEHVRDGFDGYLSCYKYHTRAMSPIHARVVFDQGPPELFDSKERWIYQLTTACSVLVDCFCANYRTSRPQQNAESPLVLLASVMQSLFVSESIRVREASIKTLVKLLSLGCCDDLYLTPYSGVDIGVPVQSGYVAGENSSHSPDISSQGLGTESMTQLKPITPVSINSATFLSVAIGFHEKFILFYLRIMGLCWMTSQGSLSAPNENKNGSEYFSIVGLNGVSTSSNGVKSESSAAKQQICILDDLYMKLAKHAPKFVGNDIFYSCAAGVSTNGDPPLFTLDKIVSRDKLVGTLCHSLASALRLLASIDSETGNQKKWCDALNSVLYRCLCKCRLAVSVRTEWNSNLVADMMGCGALLGFVPPGYPYPGCEVDCFYGSSKGRVLSFDISSQLVTMLLVNKQQLLTVRASDVAVCQGSSSLKVMDLEDFVNRAVLDLMDSMKSFIWPLVSDMLCTFHPEHPFIRQVLLRAVRPVETAIFYQLLRYVAGSFNSVWSSEILSRNELFMTLVQFCARNEQISLDSIQLRLTSSRCFVSDSWSKAGAFVSGVPDKVSQMDFPPNPEGDKCFADYSNKNLGIVVDTLPDPTCSMLLKNGMLCELIYSLSGSTEPAFHVGKDQLQLSVCPPSFLSSEYSTASNRSPSGPYSSFKNNGSFDLSDSDTLAALRLFYNLRSGILRQSQKLITAVLSSSTQSFSSMTLYWKTVLWHSFSSKHIINSGPDVSSLVKNMCRALSREHQTESIRFLSNCLRYASVSLFHINFNRTAHGRNILEHTDVYERLLKAAQSWIHLNGTTSVASIEMCLHLLKVLLPALAFIECASVELRVLNLCQLAVHSLLMTVMSFRSGYGDSGYDLYLDKGSEIYELSRGSSFFLLWSSAHEQLMKEKGRSISQLSTKATLLVHMAASMETIQRIFRPATVSTVLCTPPPMRKMVSRGNFTQKPDEFAFVPSSPRGLEMYATLAEIDLQKSFRSADNWVRHIAEGVECFTCDNDAESTALCIELQIKLHSDDEDTEFETIYFGTSRRVVHGGLSAGTKYDIRCRCYCYINLPCSNTGGSSISSEWSECIELVTLSSSIPFKFDQFSCGPDILLSESGVVASYTGDDSWSTVLGTQSFVHGINSWEIRVTSSSTAYLFIGIATSQADLNTFLGGCKNGWGFIGEQALYHNREKVKIYGEPFMAGDIVGVTVNLISGTLSFTRNGKSLGVAFDKLYGEFFPAVAFYNVGQEVEIVCDSAMVSSCCPYEPIPCSPSRIHLDDISLLLEAVYCLSASSPFSSRLLDCVSSHCSSWFANKISRHRLRSGRQVMLELDSPLLLSQGFKVGEKVRTPYGVALVAGVAYSRVWFKQIDSGEVWFFSKAQISSGRDNGMFQRCTYNDSVLVADNLKSSSDPKSVPTSARTLPSTEFDALALSDLLDPGKWSKDLDCVLVSHLLASSQNSAISPWSVTAEDVYRHFREIQLLLSKYVMRSVTLSHRWGISGPKRRAVIARIGLIRYLNHLAEHNMSALMQLGNGVDTFTCEKVSMGDDLYPFFTTIRNSSCKSRDLQDIELYQSSVAMSYAAKSNWPIISVFWGETSFSRSGTLSSSQPLGSDFVGSSFENRGNIILGHAQSPFASLRYYLFCDVKLKHFFDAVARSSFRSAKTDDEYDYPDDLPQVKLNRFRSFRAMEASTALGVPGEDLYMSTMFCQLWKELRAHSVEKLRMSYTHPMDDGQSRAFKVKFEGEGVDDYGGPYREVFQKICEELQAPDKSSTRGHTDADTTSDKQLFSCFVPLLLQTRNWTCSDGECEERYKFTFNPSSSSPLHLDLFTFLGQFVGLAIRSKITLDLPLPSVIWKMVLREPLNVDDIASFDASAASFVIHLGSLYARYIERCDRTAPSGIAEKRYSTPIRRPLTPSQLKSESSPEWNIGIGNEFNADDQYAPSPVQDEIEALIQDLTWTIVRSDGKIVELIEGGSDRPVTIDNLGEYLSLHVQARLLECAPAAESFRNGFLSAIPENSLTLLCWRDLQQIVCGADIIDVSRLKANAEYDDDVSPEDDHIVAFWDVLENQFSEEEKVLFLRFVWARPSLPPKGTEFSQKLKIQSAVGEESDLKPDQYLPKAHTCFFSINLPRYSSKDILADRLRYAIRNCTEMDADFRLTDTDVAGWTSYSSQVAPSGNLGMFE